ncbi:MAG: hypothetical protein WAV51_00470 [Microgenomates group bacterium]
MGKLFGLAFFVFIGFLSLFFFGKPVHFVEQSVQAAVVVPAQDDPVIEAHIVVACENTVSSYMGVFDDSQTAVDSCKEILLQHYTHRGIWPGPQMVTTNCSAAHLAAKEVSEAWAGLNFSSASITFTYRAEDAREILMQYMKQERELLEQGL